MKGLTTQLRSVFANAFDRIRKGELKTLIPFLCMFKAGGKPLDLRFHYQFAPVYNTVQPNHCVFMCSRQVGKSWSMASDTHMRSGLVPNYHVMIVQPRADQIQRFNGTVFQPLMRSSPLRPLLISTVELAKLSLKTYNNGSLVYLESMYMNADRIRGASGLSTCIFDEVQDLDLENINVANETMSASMFWGFSRYTGTPKTTDTTLALLWNRSSQAEWVIRCRHCGKFNVPSPEQDLLQMIGKEGPVCAHCGGSISPADGGYVHAYPDRAATFAGYHISQPIHPLHANFKQKWARLLEKMENYETLTLYNEVFGWPYDAATTPLTLADIKQTSGDLPKVEKPSDVEALRKKYCYFTIGVDWGGGGAISDSYTAYALLGRRAGSDVIDVLYGRRLPKDMSPSDETREIMSWVSGARVNAFAYDNGGAGFARLEMMKHAGLMSVPGITVVPINYVAPRSGDVMRPHTHQREPDLYYYTLDKSRSLAVCIQAIKSRRIHFQEFDERDEQACVRDFLALREDPSRSARGETVILIAKKPGVPDDFAHAVNFGCSQMWDHFGAYPRIGSRYDTSALEYDETGNLVDLSMSAGPRGDFDRFQDAIEMKVTTMNTGGDYYGW